MNHLRNLRKQLEERKDTFYTVAYDDFVGEAKLFLDFVHSNSNTAALVEKLNSDQETTFEQWRDDANAIGRLSLPGSEIGRATICMGILMNCIEDENPDMHFHWANWLGRIGGEDEVAPYLAARIVEPLFHYFNVNLGNSSNILYLLQRFKAKAEWFRREELHGKYMSDYSKGERVLNDALRESLFDSGIDYPFSELSSPSGRADVVALLGSDDPLVLEVKIYDPVRKRSERNLRQGFHQVVRYVNDFNESVGYLVVFNCSSGLLTLPSSSSESTENPPKVVYGGKTFFLIVIDIGVDRASASKESPASRTDISLEELTGPAS